ncbi:MAG: hypothetical protein P8Z00_12940 [Anaerolineales bacterium]
MDTKYVILILAVAFVMGWFAYGMIFNLRRGDKLLNWLRGGLPRIGEKTTFRWLGSSVAEMVINRAKKPFRSLVTMLVFAPRDVPWMWALARINGRRDAIIFRADLSVPPRVDLELADPHSWTGRLILRQLAERGWEARPYNGQQLMAPKGLLDYATSTLDQLASPSQELALHYWRFSLRRQSPHLELHIPQPDTNRIEAIDYFEALRKLAQSISE